MMKCCLEAKGKKCCGTLIKTSEDENFYYYKCSECNVEMKVVKIN